MYDRSTRKPFARLQRVCFTLCYTSFAELFIASLEQHCIVCAIVSSQIPRSITTHATTALYNRDASKDAISVSNQKSKIFAREILNMFWVAFEYIYLAKMNKQR